MGWGESGFNCWGGQGFCARGVVLRDATAVSLAVPTFDDTGSLGSPPRHVLYPPCSMVLPWVSASCFFAGNSEADELKPTTFS